jgi:two-component system, OmpR family, response regulator
MDPRSVLLIDDDPDIQRIAEFSLAAVGGWKVYLAGSGEAGLAAARAHQPDVVLLDVMMPGLDGPGVLARIQGDPALAGLPVIFMTAKAQRSEVQAYLALGATGVITKPFDPMLLASQVLALVKDI